MRSPRFFCPDFDSKQLDSAQSHHALHVLRLKGGELVTLFNGQGQAAQARILSGDRRVLQFEVLEVQELSSISRAGTLILAQAILKPKAMDLVLQKATELGVNAIWPILTQHTAIGFRSEQYKEKHEKWQQVLVESCKQCGLNWLPQLHPICSLQIFFEQTAAQDSLRLIGSLEADAQPLASVLTSWETSPTSSITFLVGPEGDFAATELEQARHAGFIPVSLGENILRSETASLFLTSVLAYQLQKKT